jgi:DNA-directed RNA polymerase subunit beta
VIGRAATYEAIVKGEEIKTPHIPSTFNVLVSELKSLGLNVELIKKQSLK